MARGTVKFYNENKGWGGISSAELPDGFDAWVHFSAIEAEGYRFLISGQDVEFEYEPCVQDSWRFRATRVVVLRPGHSGAGKPP
jgi:cold shock protein